MSMIDAKNAFATCINNKIFDASTQCERGASFRSNFSSVSNNRQITMIMSICIILYDKWLPLVTHEAYAAGDVDVDVSVS